jgi:hypothetical protein
MLAITMACGRIGFDAGAGDASAIIHAEVPVFQPVPGCAPT